ncbi:hypothetical protein ACWEP1_37870, partial [Streptomyces sp. NPDC004285]
RKRDVRGAGRCLGFERGRNVEVGELERAGDRSGFIGTNRSCARETVSTLLDDLDAGLLTAPAGGGPAGAGHPDAVGLAGWRAIDERERAEGERQGRPRVKLADREALIEAARSGERRRRTGGLFSRRPRPFPSDQAG